MNNKIEIFRHEQFGEIRCLVDEKGEPWFVGKDVAEKMGYRDNVNALKQHVEGEDKLRWQITTSGQRRTMTIINESGLYALAFASKLPQAMAFKRWVTSEVLPQIRKTGGYIPCPPQSSLQGEVSDAEILSRALMIAQKTIELKNGLLAAQAPKVMFADAVAKSVNSILVRDLAKLISQNGVKIGAGRLWYWLRLKHYVFQEGTSPRQEWVTRGLFEVQERVDTVGKHQFVKLTTRVTGKGQEYFVNGFVSGRFCAENGRFK